MFVKSCTLTPISPISYFSIPLPAFGALFEIF
jgi:hypothetical protein